MVDVGRALDLLGGHVERRAQHRAVAGERVGSGAVGAPGQLGEAEVDDLDVEAVLVAGDEEEVLRLEIAVDDAGGVGAAEAAQGVGGDGERVRGGEATAPQAGREVFPLEQLHDEEGLPPSVSPVSKIWTMWALSTAATARASRWKRARAAASSRPTTTNLSATRLPMATFCAS